MKFSRPFWRSKVGDADFFGRISNTREARGMFGVFYDLSPKQVKAEAKDSSPTTFSDLCIDSSMATTMTTAVSKSEPTVPSTTTATTTTSSHPSQSCAAGKASSLATTPTLTSSPLLHSLSAKSAVQNTTSQNSPSLPSTLSSSSSYSSNKTTEDVYILVTTVSGEALSEYQKLSDVEIIEKCLKCLRQMFPTENVPSPSGHVVSRWGADPFAQMSYSYAAVGSTGEDYDCMAQDVAGKIFFAGEVYIL